MYYLTTPDRDNRHQLARIIPPRFRSCVEDDQGRADIVLIGAYVDHAPVGLLIGAPNESTFIHSVPLVGITRLQGSWHRAGTAA
jgi:hypothetical protein